jgi:hypothetical protein
MPLLATNLTQRPPRSPRVRLGGYVILPRILDKGRATLAGTNGEYIYGCPLDLRFFDFVGLEPDALKQQLAAGLGDNDVLAWIRKTAATKRTDAEIKGWSDWQENRAPMDPEGRSYFNEIHSKVAPTREDIASWFDLLDVDDFASFGGKP